MLNHFNYWLTGYGWAEVFFTSDTQSVRFEFSYLSDPLAELIESLLGFLQNSQDRAEIDFFDEPGCFRLTLMRFGDELKMEIRSDNELEGSPDIPAVGAATKPLFETSDKIENICSVVNAGIVDLRSRHNETEYFEEWINYPFPIEQYRYLEQELSNIN